MYMYPILYFYVQDWIPENWFTFLLGYMKFYFKNILLKSILLVVFITSINIDNKAQLAVSGMLTPQDLVENVLLGTGVTVFNITYQGDSISMGYFTGNTNLGLQSGVLLTSGSIYEALGPNSLPNAGANTNLPGDPDLTAISSLYSPSGNPIDTYDHCILEFDFIPQSDTLRFRYVFASDEYHEYSNSTVNDVFAFFISGPGITGPYSSPPAFPGGSENIALIPGTTTGVSINTVNNGTNNTGPCLNCQYHIHNGQNSVEYDAWTTIFTAQAVVIPCLTYHIKLAIADGGDHVFDSGVFLEANSFSADAIEIETNYTRPSVDTNAIEGCNNAIISFVLPKPSASGYIIPISIGGTAPNDGSDYPVVPTNIFIPAGQDSTAIEIIPYYDSIQEGTEYVKVVFPKSICLTDYDTITINIRDNMPMHPMASNDTAIICGDTANLIVVDSGGIIPYTYTWSTGDTVPSIFVSPIITTEYYNNSTAIGYNAEPSGSNQVKLGNNNVTSLYCMGAYVGIVTGGVDLFAVSSGQIGYHSSSIQYTENVTDMNNIAWIYNLRPVNFTYKQDDQKSVQYGLIAEEVEHVNPDFVTYNQNGEIVTVAYSQLISPMLKAMQEQQELIQQLMTRIEELEK